MLKPVITDHPTKLDAQQKWLLTFGPMILKTLERHLLTFQRSLNIPAMSLPFKASTVYVKCTFVTSNRF